VSDHDTAERIGTGAAELLVLAHHQFSASKLYGVESAEEMLAKARAKKLPAALELGFVEHLPCSISTR
jgi:trans-aconitate methyltransferase